ncbi:YceI family protein [Acinetobacter sp. CAAS 2-6]|uniref:YceI family protein n=1 Tax=Acinetobacter sp. CAAS 2-6 TaxID=3016358 RepID=UPI002DD689CD|nr:YceI family protein [Acinetobacter sp. CAAS 2-6]
MKFDPTTPQNASAQLVLQMNSVCLNKSGLKDLLLGEGVFFVEQYPTARFNSREFIVLGNHQYDIKGDLTLRGITQPVTLKTRLKPNSNDPQLLDVDVKTVVKRGDFGMKKAFAGIGEK